MKYVAGFLALAGAMLLALSGLLHMGLNGMAVAMLMFII